MQFKTLHSLYPASVIFLMACKRSYMMIIFIICFILASSSTFQPTFSTVMTVQIKNNNNFLDICINNNIRAFHLEFRLDAMSSCYYYTEIYLPGGSGGENKTVNNKCCIELMLWDTVISTNNFTLTYKIIIGPVKKDINIIIRDARTNDVLEKVRVQRNYGLFKMTHIQQHKLKLQIVLSKACFQSFMIIRLNYLSQPCTFTLAKYTASNINLVNKDTVCSVIKFGSGKFLTNDEMLLEFEASNQIYEAISVHVVFNKLIIGYFVVRGKSIVTDETNYIPNKIDASSSNNVDNPQSQVYLNLPLLEDTVGNMSRFSVVVAHSNGIISKSGIVLLTDRFIDKTYEECQNYHSSQQQQNECVYEVNITDSFNLALSDAPLNYTEFVLGATNQCTKHDGYFCNGPLRSGYFYNVSLRVYDYPNGRYKTTDPVEVRTQISTSINPIPMWSITYTVTIVISCLTILIITVVCVIVRRNKYQSCSIKGSGKEYLGDDSVYSYIHPVAVAAAAASSSSASSTSNARPLSESNSNYSIIDESHEPHYTYIVLDDAAMQSRRPENTINEEYTTDTTTEMSNVYETNTAAQKTVKHAITAV